MMLKPKIQFYTSIATLYDAGIPLSKALRQPMPLQYRRVAIRMAEAIEHGEGTLADCMAFFPRHFSPLEVRLVAVGEHTGSLEIVLRALGSWAERRLNTLRTITSGLWYPVLLYTVAGLCIPLMGLVAGHFDAASAVAQMFLFWLTPLAILCAFNLIGKLVHAHNSVWLGNVQLSLPLVSVVWRKLDYARFFQAYALGLNAGLGCVQAVHLAADVCCNASIRQRFHLTANRIEVEGLPFWQVFKRYIVSGEKSNPAFYLLESGETSGYNDEMVRKVADMYQQDAENMIRWSARLIPVLIYLALMVYIGYTIIIFWQNLYSTLFDIG